MSRSPGSAGLRRFDASLGLKSLPAPGACRRGTPGGCRPASPRQWHPVSEEATGVPVVLERRTPDDASGAHGHGPRAHALATGNVEARADRVDEDLRRPPRREGPLRRGRDRGVPRSVEGFQGGALSRRSRGRALLRSTGRPPSSDASTAKTSSPSDSGLHRRLLAGALHHGDEHRGRLVQPEIAGGWPEGRRGRSEIFTSSTSLSWTPDLPSGAIS